MMKNCPICLFVGPKSKDSHLTTMKKHNIQEKTNELEVHDDFGKAVAFIDKHIQASYTIQLPSRSKVTYESIP